MDINSLKSLLDYKIEDIDDNVIESGIKLFKNVKEQACQYDIMRVLTNILMSGKKCSDGTLDKYDECCQIYLRNTCRLIRRPKIQEWDNVVIENAKYILYNSKLYISRFDTLDENMYTTIFKIMTNLAFKDIIDEYFVYYAFNCYNEIENESLRVNVVYFLQNVYLDDNWINNEKFTEKYTKCIQHFIHKYYIIHPLLSMELLNDAKILFPQNREWIDLILSLMEQNAENYEIFEKCVIYLNNISNVDMMKYIVESTIVKMIINKVINTGDDTITFLLTKMLVNFTSCVDTEVPCEFYYKYIFNRLIIQEKLIDIYPKYILFGLSNIVCEKVNFDFININDVLSYVANTIIFYNDCQELCIDIYHIINNLKDVLSSFKEIISHKKFMDTYAGWMYMDDIKLCRVTRMMFHYIAYNEECHYMYKSLLSERVMELSKDSHIYKRIVNKYMNFSLEQKCAKLLYKMGKIDSNDLEALDVTIY